MKKALIAIGLGLALIGAAYLLFSGGGPRKEPPSAAHRTYVAAEGKVEVMPGFEAEVGSELEGRIAESLVKEGDNVKKGQLLAVIGNSDIKARLIEAEAECRTALSKYEEIASGSRKEEVAKAEAMLRAALSELDLAAKSLERNEGLFREGFISKDVLDEKVTAHKVAGERANAAREELALLEKGPKDETLKFYSDAVKRAAASVEFYRALLKKSMIASPISGKVIRKYLEAGEMISKESNMMAVADTGRLRVNAEIDETDIGRLKIGDRAEVTSDAYPGRVFAGEVEEISGYVGIRGFKPNNPAKNIDMKIIQTKIVLKEDALFRPGMTVDVKIVPR